MNKKYILTDETICYYLRTLHRIKAIKDFGDIKSGDLGGFIEKEDNLSHFGNSWVYGNAKVYGNAEVYGNAGVFDNARIAENAKVFDNAKVYGNANVFDDAVVCTKAKVGENAWVFRDAEVCGAALVCGDSRVCEKAKVGGNAEVCGEARVDGEARIVGDAKVCGKADYLCFKGFGSSNRRTTVFKSKKGIEVVCGCFLGALEEFQNQVIKTHGDNKFAKEYLAMIELIKIHFDIS